MGKSTTYGFTKSWSILSALRLQFAPRQPEVVNVPTPIKNWRTGLTTPKRSYSALNNFYRVSEEPLDRLALQK